MVFVFANNLVQYTALGYWQFIFRTFWSKKTLCAALLGEIWSNALFQNCNILDRHYLGGGSTAEVLYFSQEKVVVV